MHSIILNLITKIENSSFIFLSTSKLQGINNMYNKLKKSIYFHTNYRAEMKLVPIIKDYCPLQFDALKFFLGAHLREGSLSNFNFSNISLQIFERNHEVPSSNCLETNFHDISNILRAIRVKNYS